MRGPHPPRSVLSYGNSSPLTASCHDALITWHPGHHPVWNKEHPGNLVIKTRVASVRAGFVFSSLQRQVSFCREAGLRVDLLAGEGGANRAHSQNVTGTDHTIVKVSTDGRRGELQ